MKKTFRHMFAFSCLLTAAVALGGCTTPEGEKVGLGHIVGSFFQHAEVAPEEVPVLDFANPLGIADREIDELTMAMQRPVIVNIHNLEEAVTIVKEIGDTSSITSVGTFVISEEMLAKVQAEVDRMRTEEGRTTAFLLLDVETGAGLAYNIDKSYYSASSIKAINMCSLCVYAPNSYYAHSSYMRGALVDSSNAAYEAIFETYGDHIPNKWRLRVGLGYQTIGRMYTHYPVRDFARLWLGCWDYLQTEGDAQESLKTWMSATLMSAYTEAFGEKEGYQVCSKAGWEQGEVATCNEGGYIVTPAGTYLLCIMTDRAGHPKTYLTDLTLLLDEAYQEYAPQKARK